MTHYGLFFFVLDALSNQMLISLTPNLPQHEADLVFEETCLSLRILLREQLTEDFPGLT